jgi:uncharacterized membrane protein YkvA (DUF1232 family)
MAKESWRERIQSLQVETYALYLAARDRRTPWYAKAWAALVAAYAFSPLDLIPDPIPILGYLDDLVLVPLGVLLALKLIPKEVMADSRQRAKAAFSTGEPTVRWGAIIVIVLWVLVAAGLGGLAWRALAR